MRFLYFFVHCLLLFTVPLFAVPPPPPAPLVVEDRIDFLFTYDDVIDLLEAVEEGDLEESCSEEQLKKIHHFLARLARAGIRDDDAFTAFVLEHDTRELLQMTPCVSRFSSPYGDELIPCRSWAQKQIHHGRKYVKRHKKAIIIGAVVVVAALAVIVTVSALAAPAAAGVGSLAAQSKKEKEPLDIAEEVMEAPLLSAVIEEEISLFKEEAIGERYPLETDDVVFSEKVRQTGAYLVHKIVDEVAEAASFIPKMCEEIQTICGVGEESPHAKTPLMNYEKGIAAIHEKTDDLFEVDQAKYFTKQAKEERRAFEPEIAVGVIPVTPSGVMGSSCFTGRVPKPCPTTGRLLPTEAASIHGWKKGEPIHNRNAFGMVPKWSTVRKRYWKNRAEWAKSHSHTYGDENISRMERGLAPQRFNKITGNIESIELHHIPPQREGGLFDFIEVSPDKHAEIDLHRHIGG